MHTDALSAPNGLRLRLAAGTAGALVVVPAMLASTIVFSEPAIADMLMMGVILALPIIGVMKPGRAALSGLTAWLVIVAAEMLTGGVGIGFWVWDECNNLNVAHILIAIFVIGIVGLVLEQMLMLIARRFSYDH